MEEGNRQLLELRARREAVVNAHRDAELRQDFEAALRTFAVPRYEFVATGAVYDTPQSILAYYTRSREAFPDQSDELLSVRHADDAVIVEAIATGTNTGPWEGNAPTGRAVQYQAAAFLIFQPETDKLICERVYHDRRTIAAQLGVGLNDEP